MKRKTLALFSAAVMAAAAMTGCSNNTAPTSPSTEETTKAPEAPSTEAVAETAAEEQKKELVILGGNGAGLIAAIQAAEDGINPSKILILSGSGELAADMKEKEDFINASETAEQFEAEIDDTYDTFLSDTLKAGKNSNNQDMAEFLVESAEEAKNWVEGLGIKLTGVEKKDGSSLARSYTLADGGSLSEALSEALVKKVEDLKIPVKTGAEVKEIVMNADGVVTGVKAEIDGTEETIDSIAVVAADKDLLPVLSGMEIQLTKAADEKATGIIVNSCAEVLDAAGEPVPGIYAVGGLIDAGVHGEAVLPGNDLTATVVFGETAGVESAIYISDNRE